MKIYRIYNALKYSIENRVHKIVIPIGLVYLCLVPVELTTELNIVSFWAILNSSILITLLCYYIYEELQSIVFRFQFKMNYNRLDQAIKNLRK